VTAITLQAGQVSLDEWRRICAGAQVALDARCMPAIEAGAATVTRIVERGAPVYGINTGFGKLASVRIATPTSSGCSAHRAVALRRRRRSDAHGRRPAHDGAQLASLAQEPRACGLRR
jgi:histidine ammonia-lyase